MTFITKNLTAIFKTLSLTRNFCQSSIVSKPQSFCTGIAKPSLGCISQLKCMGQSPLQGFASSFFKYSQPILQGVISRNDSTLLRMHRRGDPKPKRRKKNPLGEENKPFAKGVVIRTVIRKPKKPNSANRRCVIVKLSTGKEMCAYVPGEGHNLQEHNVVLCRVGRLRDVPGVKIKCVRGKYDLGHVVKKIQ